MLHPGGGILDLGNFSIGGGISSEWNAYSLVGSGPAPFHVAMSFAPTVAAVGQTVTVSLTLPGGLSGLTALSINGVPVTSYSVNSSGQLVFVVPPGATSGLLWLTINGQIYASTSPLVILRPAGLAEAVNSAPLRLHPNPARERVTLSGASGTVQLLDALGRVVRTTPVERAHPSLDLRGVPAGVYLVRSGTQVRRLVVE